MPFTGGTIRWAGSPRPRLPDLTADEATRVRLARTAVSIARDIPMLLHGAIGAGKTSLMAEIDFWLQMRDPAPAFSSSRRWWLSEPNWWTTAEGYVSDVRMGWSFGDPKKGGFPDWGPDYSADGIAPRVKRLFLDDLGVEMDTDNATETVGKLLRDRHAAGLPTWITTNLSPEELRARYGPRVVSRLAEQCMVVNLGGGDRRLPMDARLAAAR